jgi:Membrane domain of glycerophosphoryl diester phosphodiesterase
LRVTTAPHGVEKSMETVELRPLSLGELLDRTFTLYRRHFWVFVGIMAIPSSFAIPFNVFFLSKEGNLFASSAGPFPPTPAAPIGTAAPQLAEIGILFVAVFAFLLVFVVAYCLAMGAATYAVGQAYLGEATTVRDAYRKVVEKFWRLIGVTINILLRMFGIMLLVFGVVGGVVAVMSMGIAGLGGGGRAALAVILALVILAAYLGGMALFVYLALRYAVSIPVLMLENRGALDSIRRSVQLTRGRRGQIFVAFLLAGILGYVGAIVFQGPFWIPIIISMMHGNPPPGWLLFCASVSAAMGGSITGPISMIVLVLCYYDARIRKEAFDLEFMMSALNKPATMPGTVSPA